MKLGENTVYTADLGLDLDLDGTYEYGVKLTHTGSEDTDYSASFTKVGHGNHLMMSWKVTL